MGQVVVVEAAQMTVQIAAVQGKMGELWGGRGGVCGNSTDDD